MKFLAITLIPYAPDPITGIQKSTTERLREVVDNATLAEELGFDGYGVGERHERPFISSSPPVVLSHIAARTSTIRLFTTVTTLSLLDPVRAFEDYSTLDHRWPSAHLVSSRRRRSAVDPPGSTAHTLDISAGRVPA